MDKEVDSWILRHYYYKYKNDVSFIFIRYVQFYRGAIERPKKYYTFLTDHDKLIGGELLRRGILECHLSTAWLDNLMKEWKQTYPIYTSFRLGMNIILKNSVI
jgi:hypothetical protein